MWQKSGYALICAVGLCRSGAGYARSAGAGRDVLLQGALDLVHDTITLPLHEGALADGRKVWFVLTDTDDRAEAERRGLAYAPELSAAANVAGSRRAEVDASDTFVFAAGTVDFSPRRSLTPGDAPHPFPPKAFSAGAVADRNYSPFVVGHLGGRSVVYNAPIVAFDVPASAIGFCDGSVDYDKVHDRVARICPEKGEVTVRLSHGFADGKSLVYLSFDANDPMAATMEAATHAPALDNLHGTGAELNIYAVANGATGATNAERQGFDSALSGEGSPLNVLDQLPGASDGYSPLWDLHLGAWSDRAILAGERHRLTSEGQFLEAVAAGQLTGPGGGTFGSTGILVNCPVVAVLD